MYPAPEFNRQARTSPSAHRTSRRSGSTSSPTAAGSSCRCGCAAPCSRNILFERTSDILTSRPIQVATFMPIRGEGGYGRAALSLTDDNPVRLHLHSEQDADTAALAAALGQVSAQDWTGVTISPYESFEWLELWLACHEDGI